MIDLDGDPFRPFGPAQFGADDAPASAEALFEPLQAPPSAGPPLDWHQKLGKVTGRWAYFDADGTTQGYTCRFKRLDGGKEFRPQRYGRWRGREGWHWKGWSDDRPLYGLPGLQARPLVPVLVVEGEKAADAAAVLFPELSVVSPMNGAQSPHFTDWSPMTGRHVVIWPDADEPGRAFAGKVGQLALEAGAVSVRIVAVPHGAPKGWDLADPLPKAWSEQTLAAALASAVPPGVDASWREPDPLSDEERPFPLDALPPIVREAVVEYQAHGQQPVPMVVCAVLGAMVGAVQGLVDVRIENGLVRPVSLNLLVVAVSGERKTSCDAAFAAAGERWAKAEAARLAPEIAAAREARKGHDAHREGLLQAIRAAAGKGKKAKDAAEADLAELKRQLQAHGRTLPPMPPMPRPRIENATIEGVASALRLTWPSLTWASAEGGSVTGGHAFRDDAIVSTLAFINSRWDGAPLDRARSTEEFSRCDGRRLSTSLMLQPAAFAALVGRGSGLARGLGTLARNLMTWPRSTMGTRLRDADAPEPEFPALGRFLDRAEALHRLPLPMPFDLANLTAGEDEEGNPAADQLELSPLQLPLDPQARRLWLRFHNEMEGELAPEGELADVQDVAAKAAENACRLAAVFHVWEHGPNGVIGSAAMDRGVVVARWFAFEARRVLAATVENETVQDAELLARWIRTRGTPPTLDAAAREAPYRLRNKPRRKAAIELLVEAGWLRQDRCGGKTVLVLNPRLDWEE